MELPRSIAGSLFAAAALLQLAGVLLILLEMQTARRLAGSPNRNTIDGGGADGASTMNDSAGDVIAFLLDSRARQRGAVIVLVAGILIGTAGNFAALWAA
ncbi:hypothetical protein [Plantibacter sp. T3]|uniref:hypothetical protein n=1 Tax=Plantibacter sp. T3 TaxID=2653161 RepID=UPI0012F41907|nr:hypothetical protein [Plantibacter sp. T3]VXB06065.1 conserved hypothetical protein [Plantibacter sp. T3]